MFPEIIIFRFGSGIDGAVLICQRTPLLSKFFPPETISKKYVVSVFSPVSLDMWVRLSAPVSSFAILFAEDSPDPYLTTPVVALSVIQETVTDESEIFEILTSFGESSPLAPILNTCLYETRLTPKARLTIKISIPIIVGIFFFFMLSVILPGRVSLPE